MADTRIHGTAKKQVRRMFEMERPALQPLPVEPFPFYHEGRRKVHRDAHIEVAGAYYSIPPEYLSSEVWVRWDSRLVRVFNQRFEQIAIHARVPPGRFNTIRAHITDEKISGVERGAEYLLSKAARIGTEALEWAEAILEERGIEGVRVLLGFIALSKNTRLMPLTKPVGTPWGQTSSVSDPYVCSLNTTPSRRTMSLPKRTRSSNEGKSRPRVNFNNPQSFH